MNRIYKQYRVERFKNKIINNKINETNILLQI